MKNHLFLLILFVGSFCFSQEQTTTNNTKLPISIYTTSYKNTKLNIPSYASVKKNLTLNTSFNFIGISFEDIESEHFLISGNNLKTKSTRFIYDDYKSYRDENLLKGFIQKYDLTRWNPCNYRQPNIN